MNPVQCMGLRLTFKPIAESCLNVRLNNRVDLVSLGFGLALIQPIYAHFYRSVKMGLVPKDPMVKTIFWSQTWRTLFQTWDPKRKKKASNGPPGQKCFKCFFWLVGTIYQPIDHVTWEALTTRLSVVSLILSEMHASEVGPTARAATGLTNWA